MALPFDLRSCAPFHDPDDSADVAATRAAPRGARPSRAVVILPDMVERVQARDVDAFRELVRLTYIPLVRFAITIVGSRDEAEDVVQDVFTTLWDRATRWNPSGDPAAYLFASTRNHALNALRRSAREAQRAQRAHETVAYQSEALADTTPDALSDAIQAEAEALRARAVAVVLETLTERQRTAYDLRYRRGLTAPAISQVLGITVKSAEQLVSRVTHLVWERLQKTAIPIR